MLPHKIPITGRKIILILSILILSIPRANAATIALRHAVTHDTDLSVSVGEEFELEIFVDPQGKKVTAVSAYISFDETALELIDTDTRTEKIVPVEPGPNLPNGWQNLENDTHGDPGNRFRDFQIDFAQGLAFGSEPAITEPSIIGLIHFRAIRQLDSVEVKFDNIASASRMTSLRVGMFPSSGFGATISPNIFVGSKIRILDTFPKSIKFTLGTNPPIFNIDKFVRINDSIANRIEYSVTASEHISAQIDRETHIVQFTAAPDWFGLETITITLSDGGENSSNIGLDVVVTTPPTIDPQTSPFRVRAGEMSNYDLSQLVFDLDDPNLLGLTWKLIEGSEFASLNVVGNSLSMMGISVGSGTITLEATDADENSTVGNFAIEVTEGLSIDASFPSQFSLVNSGSGVSIPPIELDDFAFDFDYSSEQLTWETLGNKNVTVNIDPVTHEATFQIDPTWIGEENIRFIVRNPDNQYVEKTLKITVTAPKTPPVVAMEFSLTIIEGREDSSINLNQHVQDLDTPIEEILWRAENFEPLQVTIDADSKIVTITAPVGSIGNHSATFTATDPDNLSDGKTISIEVIAEPLEKQSPVVEGIPNIEFETGTIDRSIMLSDYVSDVDTPRDQISWSYSGNVDVIINVNPTTSIVTMSAVPGFGGEEKVTFTATDADNLSNSQEITVTVTLTKFPPSIDKIPNVEFEAGSTDSSIILDDFVSDADTPKTEILWSVNAPAELQISIDDETHAVSISGETSGDFQVTFTATDPEELNASQTITVTVIEITAEKKPPVVDGIQNVQFEAGTIDRSIVLDDYVADPDTFKSELNWTFSGNRDILIDINQDTRTVTLSAMPGFFGEEEVTFTATDPDNLSDSQTITVVVTEAVDQKKAPIVAGIPDVELKIGDSDNSIALDNYVSDEDTLIDLLVWEVDTPPTIKVTIAAATHLVELSSAGGIPGDYQITFTATDPDNLSGFQAITVTLSEVITEKKPPKVSGIPDVTFKSGQFDGSLMLDQYVTDADTSKNELTWSVSGNQNITADIDPITRQVNLSATENFSGDEKITFTATDLDDLSDSQTITVTVSEVAIETMPPVVSGIPDITFDQGKQDLSVFLDDFVSDSDTPKSEISWSFGGNTNISVSIDGATHQVTFSSEASFVGTETINFIATDPENNSHSQTIGVTVKKKMLSGLPPLFVKNFPNITVAEGVVTPVMDFREFAVDADTPLSQLIWSTRELRNISIQFTTAVSGEGEAATSNVVVEITPNLGFAGREKVIFVVSDPEGNQAEASSVVTALSVATVESQEPVIPLPEPIELKANKTKQILLDGLVNDGDTSIDEIIWVAKENPSLSATISADRILTLAVDANMGNFRGLTSLLLTATDPEGNSAVGILSITVLEPDDETRPELQIFALPNPIESDFITITILCNEALKTNPTVKVNGAPIDVRQIGDENRWSSVYLRSAEISDSLNIVVDGQDLAGNGSRKTKSVVMKKTVSASPDGGGRGSENFELFQNYPNPIFGQNLETTIAYNLPERSEVSIAIYNVLGEQIRRFDLGVQNIGFNKIIWDCRDGRGILVSRGIYFYSIDAGNLRASMKMSLVK